MLQLAWDEKIRDVIEIKKSPRPHFVIKQTTKRLIQRITWVFFRNEDLVSFTLLHMNVEAKVDCTNRLTLDSWKFTFVVPRLLVTERSIRSAPYLVLGGEQQIVHLATENSLNGGTFYDVIRPKTQLFTSNLS